MELPEAELSIEDRVQSAEAEQPVEEVTATEPETDVPETTVPVRRSARIAQGVAPPERFLLLTKIKEVTDKVAGNREQAKFVAIQKEILQIF